MAHGMRVARRRLGRPGSPLWKHEKVLHRKMGPTKLDPCPWLARNIDCSSYEESY